MTYEQENKNRLEEMDYIAGAVTIIAAGATVGAAGAGATVSAGGLAVAAIIAAGAAVAVASAGKRAALCTGLALAGAFLGGSFVSKDTEISNQKNISALEKRVESRTPTNITHSLVDGRDYVTIFNKDGSSSLYQRTTNSAGTTSLTPLSEVYSNELAALRNEQRGALNMGESALADKYFSLVEKYFYLTNLLQNPTKH
jgi:hypothetical protein